MEGAGGEDDKGVRAIVIGEHEEGEKERKPYKYGALHTTTHCVSPHRPVITCLTKGNGILPANQSCP